MPKRRGGDKAARPPVREKLGRVVAFRASETALALLDELAIDHQTTVSEYVRRLVYRHVGLIPAEEIK